MATTTKTTLFLAQGIYRFRIPLNLITTEEIVEAFTLKEIWGKNTLAQMSRFLSPSKAPGTED